MDKRENVIKEFEAGIQDFSPADTSDERFKEVCNAALDLLKAQEPVKPIYKEEKYGDHLPHCGNCERVIPNNAVYGKVNFCHYCGKAVKWE